ncbi:hypothetical protein BDW74DRAFT_162041 [Aspergillus multicolor]|uniref:uncharacterized protein n=1 Tax=Aspergillus multicolor TaxID=41759 RepID=UPI003CCCFC2A
MAWLRSLKEAGLPKLLSQGARSPLIYASTAQFRCSLPKYIRSRTRDGGSRAFPESGTFRSGQCVPLG